MNKKLASLGITIILLITFAITIIQLDDTIVRADGTDYYVNGVSGSDSNNGSIIAPWKTIEYALNPSQWDAGDTIYFIEGTYTLTSKITFWQGGSVGNYLTITNYENDVVIFQGDNCPTTTWVSSMLEFFGGDYINISGINFNHSAKGAISFRNDDANIGHHNIIYNCSFTNNSQHGIKLIKSHNITISNCNFYNNFNNWSDLPHDEDGGLSQEVVSIEQTQDISVNNNTFSENRFINIDIKAGNSRINVCHNEINTTSSDYVEDYWGKYCWGEAGIYIDATSTTDNISIYNNRIWGNHTGININNEKETPGGGFEYIYIYNNIVNITKEPFSVQDGWLTGRAPITIGYDGGSTTLHHHIYIYSNTLIIGENNDYPCLFIDDFNSTTLDDVFIYNNIMASKEDYANDMILIDGFSFAQGESAFIISNNSYYISTYDIIIDWNGTEYNSSTNPEKFGNNPIFTNPNFVDFSEQNGNYHLTPTSPCIDTGNTTYISTKDFDWNERPLGNGYDIGAYETFVNTTISIIAPIPLENTPLSIDINCTPGQPVKSWEFNISFNPSVLQVTNTSEGNIFSGYSTIYTEHEINNTEGYIYLYCLILGAGNISSPGTLANINFSTSPGYTGLNFTMAGITNETAYVPLIQTNASATVTGIVLSGLSNNNITWYVFTNTAGAYWSNYSHPGGTLNITCYSNSILNITTINISMDDLDYGVIDSIPKGNISIEVINLNDGLWNSTTTSFPDNGNITINSTTWSQPWCHGTNPFIISNETIEIQIRFKLLTHSIEEGTYTDNTSKVWYYID